MRDQALRTTVNTPPNGPHMSGVEGSAVFSESTSVDFPQQGIMNRTRHRTSHLKDPTTISATEPQVAINISQRELDDQLVELSLSGDKDAYRQLVEKYQNKLFSLAFDILKTREDAEDVVQETFVKAYLSLKSFKGQSSFYTWLYRIAYNMSIDVKRRLNRRGGNHIEFRETSAVNNSGAGGEDGGFGPTPVPDDAQTIEGPSEALYRKETGSRIREVLSELSPEHRAVVVLREVDGLNYDEISEATGVPKGTVMSRLHYARKALQKALRELAPNLTVQDDGEASENQIVGAGTVIVERKT